MLDAPAMQPVTVRLQQVNEWGNRWSGLVAAATLAMLALQLLRRMK